MSEGLVRHTAIQLVACKFEIETQMPAALRDKAQAHTIHDACKEHRGGCPMDFNSRGSYLLLGMDANHIAALPLVFVLNMHMLLQIIEPHVPGHILAELVDSTGFHQPHQPCLLPVLPVARIPAPRHCLNHCPRNRGPEAGQLRQSMEMSGLSMCQWNCSISRA